MNKVYIYTHTHTHTHTHTNKQKLHNFKPNSLQKNFCQEIGLIYM
jgi:hypothetical protein